MRRALMIAAGVVLMLSLLLVARFLFAPRWESRINNARYVAYSDASQLVLCAEGMSGPALLNLLERMHLLSISDNGLIECVYVEFASPPPPGTFSLDGKGQLVVSGTGEVRPSFTYESSTITALWFERTCFCSLRDDTVRFNGELTIESRAPLSGRLKLHVTGAREDIVIDAQLSSFTEEPIAVLRRREAFYRRIRE